MATNPSQFPQAVVGGSPSFASVTVTGTVTAGPLAVPLLALQAQSPVAGTALINGTATLLTWTAPNDGALHRVMVPCSLHVTTLETGGNVSVVFTEPGNVGNSIILAPGGQAANNDASNPVMVIVRANTAVTVQQSSALTAGAATVWAEIWAS